MPQSPSVCESSFPKVTDDPRLRSIVAKLTMRYGIDRHSNLRDAFWELIFIIISVRTADRLYKPTYKNVKRRYPTIDALAAARLTDLTSILKPAGLSTLKAEQIRNAARAVLRDFGRTGLTRAGRKDPEFLEKYLMRLDGVGVKVAKCVTMYACDAEALPVDAHVWRVMSRLGYAPGGRLTEQKALQLEERVNSKLRLPVHVLCISHGREICRPTPQCGTCPVSALCPSARLD